MALATIQDIEDRLGRALTPSERARAEVLLDDASALVRTFTRREFELVEGDTITLRPVGTLLRLPQHPVQMVHEVTALSGTDTIPDLTLPPGLWTFDGIDKINVLPVASDIWVQLPEVWLDLYAETVNTYMVTYDHGYAQIPADIVAVIAGMVMRVLLAPSMIEGLVSERIGQYNYQMQQGTGLAGASVRLSPADRDTLAAYRRSTSTVQAIST